ncbi:nucleotidyltransferase family protein [Mesoterricola silvestris]|uniref:D-glycero-D-manno-heptose 1-phosphate guanosyltransferase n=1 Tax=Mesoterricola silvestris TaxID=2927979 RepID=A0AA48GSS0_9BACT|nr:nucleotidyltransferase family protein [Mesoterricola silvestris]BDU71071.1 D-glycero-D-manno-heptose 1-phosphate guanosyltransferase [Mesoterricola silvestris]
MNTASTAIVLAGGFGTRLRAVVSDLPKPLAPIRGIPFLKHLLSQIASQGIRNAVLSVGYLGEKIEKDLGYSFGPLSLSYVHEDRPLGTGGAVRFALATLPPTPGPVFVMNGDSYFPIPLHDLAQDFLGHQGALACLALKRMSPADRYGTVELGPDGRIYSFREKTALEEGLINGGIYVLSRDFLQVTPADRPFSLETDVFAPRCPQGSLFGREFDAPFIDIGIPEDYRHAQDMIPLLPGERPTS